MMLWHFLELQFYFFIWRSIFPVQGREQDVSVRLHFFIIVHGGCKEQSPAVPSIALSVLAALIFRFYAGTIRKQRG
jgi:hypothetical protein